MISLLKCRSNFSLASWRAGSRGSCSSAGLLCAGKGKVTALSSAGGWAGDTRLPETLPPDAQGIAHVTLLLSGLMGMEGNSQAPGPGGWEDQSRGHTTQHRSRGGAEGRFAENIAAGAVLMRLGRERQALYLRQAGRGNQTLRKTGTCQELDCLWKMHFFFKFYLTPVWVLGRKIQTLLERT